MIGALPSAIQVLSSGSALVFGGWWAVLALVALPRTKSHVAPHPDMRWAVIVPAHNEQRLIGDTVGSLKEAGATRDEIFVVADNCKDGTAAEAQAAGATVMERHDPDRRGKSYALDFALGHLRARAERPDAVLIVDADTLVSANVFEVLSERMAQGAQAVQIHYRGADGDAPVARVRRMALSLVHWSRPLGAARFGLPTTLKGNGMAFRWELIQDGFPGSGITEDAAATLEFLRRGHVVAFEARATVTGRMATNLSDARTQDMRWEGGRLRMIPRSLLTAFQSLARLKPRQAAAALELASPPLTLVGVSAVAGLSLAGLGFGSVPLALSAAAALATYVGLGLMAARPARADLLALAHVPRFVIHKLAVFARLTKGQPKAWERTVR